MARCARCPGALGFLLHPGCCCKPPLPPYLQTSCCTTPPLLCPLLHSFHPLVALMLHTRLLQGIGRNSPGCSCRSTPGGGFWPYLGKGWVGTTNQEEAGRKHRPPRCVYVNMARGRSCPGLARLDLVECWPGPTRRQLQPVSSRWNGTATSLTQARPALRQGARCTWARNGRPSVGAGWGGWGQQLRR